MSELPSASDQADKDSEEDVEKYLDQTREASGSERLGDRWKNILSKQYLAALAQVLSETQHGMD